MTDHKHLIEELEKIFDDYVSLQNENAVLKLQVDDIQIKLNHEREKIESFLDSMTWQKSDSYLILPDSLERLMFESTKESILNQWKNFKIPTSPSDKRSS